MCKPIQLNIFKLVLLIFSNLSKKLSKYSSWRGGYVYATIWMRTYMVIYKNKHIYILNKI